MGWSAVGELLWCVVCLGQGQGQGRSVGCLGSPFRFRTNTDTHDAVVPRDLQQKASAPPPRRRRERGGAVEAAVAGVVFPKPSSFFYVWLPSSLDRSAHEEGHSSLPPCPPPSKQTTDHTAQHTRTAMNVINSIATRFGREGQQGGASSAASTKVRAGKLEREWGREGGRPLHPFLPIPFTPVPAFSHAHHSPVIQHTPGPCGGDGCHGVHRQPHRAGPFGARLPGPGDSP